MTTSYATGGDAPAQTGSAPAHSLRALLDSRSAARAPLSLGESIALLAPLASDVAARHARGESLLLHAGCICGDETGAWKYDPMYATVPTSPQDVAVLAPELGGRNPGPASASVYAFGAILYECLTCASVGPGMQPPRAVNPSLPAGIDALLGAALVADPAARPADLAALAQAMMDLANQAHASQVDVAAAAASASASDDPFAAVQSAEPQVQKIDATTQLAQLKAQLESDPRPRYVVVKDSMDHGPFSAVELLQQIASHSFVAEHTLRDEISGESKKIGEWSDFSQFASHAKIHREIVAEKKEVVALEKAEKKAGIAKYVIGVGATAVLLSGLLLWYFKGRGARDDSAALLDDPSALDLSTDGGMKGTKKPGSGGGGGGGGGGGKVGGFGGSYEAALAANNEEIKMGSAPTGPDLSNAQLSAPMANAAFISGCGAPNDMSVTVKVAIKMGRAVGVSVYTSPPNAAVASCVDRHVRQLAWPAHPKMDSFTTKY